ncbi:spermidine synthase [Saccharopolyspora erythraea NRRL 2338]|uniref:Polyamine aminopropyltransferase n=2 Tax=Saccharopolyspora erythraea TaxID=1836 RepID=A4F6Y0_SACEN|nr:polyamine aminopropyltransferase [Saccharopolyspora erythraea]EQD85460.1 spermidine synthase [Saccharopolyspora erythraea D]PFG93605.1 spermidine synthase [Saccharopolyspora erythraea NRRL 2338]QRK90453.1 polyamine aminopropyltransferase [Saccharopolyspora erythraea]CAL99804.1 putative spermidine synthase [Saccharopolyspora erythraea NRRL 2338]
MSVSTEPRDETEPAAAPRPRGRLARTAVLVAVFVCAACGLVYELALVALGSYLIGDTIGQASIVLSLMVFAMGVGALAAKPLQRWAAAAFALVELVLALLGGLSVLLLYAAFAWVGLYLPALIVTALVLGALIGAEIPLLMVLLQRIRKQDAGSAVADLFAADYVGGLVGGLAFPFLLLPLFGQIQGALLVGMLNAAAGLGLVLTVFRRELSKRVRLVLVAASALVGGVLLVAYVFADDFEVTARQALYADPVVHAERTDYQDVVLTERVSLSGRGDTRLFLNGDLQFSSVDEYRYHEALVHPAMAGPRSRVLVLGGGDGLALREVLRYPDVQQVTLVEMDPAVLDLAREDPRVAGLNRHAFDDPRVRTVSADAFAWLRDNRERYDVVLVDMPDPDSTATAKLYSTEFYALVRHAMADGARVNVQAGSPYFAPQAFWCIEATTRAAGISTVPYEVSVPSFGEWGFHLGTAGAAPPLELPAGAPPLRSLDAGTLRAAAEFPPDRRRIPGMEPSTLMHPTILSYAQGEWTNY